VSSTLTSFQLVEHPPDLGQLVLQALSSKRATADELAEIRRMLDELEGGKR